MDARVAQVVDIQEIETLRRLYGKATDAIGRATDESVAEGTAIYHKIFTPDAKIITSGGENSLKGTGPDEWADIVLKALRDYTGTQHLIGTQLVTIDGNEALMESYVNAWHKNPDGTVYIFLGTYIDKVKRTADGWKIYDMNLRQDSGGIVETK